MAKSTHRCPRREKAVCRHVPLEDTMPKAAATATYDFSSFCFNPAFPLPPFLPLKDLEMAAGAGAGEAWRRVHITFTLLPAAGWLIPVRDTQCCRQEEERSHG